MNTNGYNCYDTFDSFALGLFYGGGAVLCNGLHNAYIGNKEKGILQVAVGSIALIASLYMTVNKNMYQNDGFMFHPLRCRPKFGASSVL